MDLSMPVSDGVEATRRILEDQPEVKVVVLTSFSDQDTVSDALAAGAPGALPVIDAKRREVFVPGPLAAAPAELALQPGTVCVGNGARRYRDVLAGLGAEIPADEDERHLPRARFHAALAADYGPAERLEPIYVRVPDAERSLAR